MENISRDQEDHHGGVHNPCTQLSIAVCGCGNDGRLGLGTCGSRSRITLLSFFLEGVKKKENGGEDDSAEPIGTIQSVRVGGYHNFVITTTGVYGWGLNENGQLGLGRGSPENLLRPTRIPFFNGERVIDIQCGAYHSFAWTEKGLFVCGKNSDGQLGLPDEDDHFSFTMLLTAAQANNKTNNASSGSNKTSTEYKESEGLCHLIQRGQLTHVSCGTHHTLLAFRDVIVIVKEDNDEIRRQDEEKQQRYPLLILAAGKGDFGELGYDGDVWSVLHAKSKAMQHALRTGALQDFDSDTSKHMSLFEKKWKPSKARRAVFSSSHFQPVRLTALLDTTVGMPLGGGGCSREIISLHAMHLHSAVILRDNSIEENPEEGKGGGGTRNQTFHWGCYYCNVPEDDSSSIPRQEEKGEFSLHAGNESLFRFDTTTPIPSAEVEVMGSGVLGLGEEDSFLTSWTPLPLPPAANGLCIRAITGREHYLILLEDKLVVGFGDNMHGQLGVGESEDAVLSPTVLLRAGDYVEAFAPSTEGTHWKVKTICDAACGVRHSVFLVEVCCAPSSS